MNLICFGHAHILNIVEYFWTRLDTHNFGHGRTITKRQKLMFVDTFGYVWILLATLGYFWIGLDTFGHVWTRLDTFGHVWPRFLKYFLIVLDLPFFRTRRRFYLDETHGAAQIP